MKNCVHTNIVVILRLSTEDKLTLYSTDLVLVEIWDDWIILLTILGLHELEDAVEILAMLQLARNMYIFCHCNRYTM